MRFSLATTFQGSAWEQRFRRPANTYDLLKSIAVLTMVIDHLGCYLLPQALWLRVIGRVAFPLFLFLVGYSGQTRTDPRLLVGAGIVSGLDYLATGTVFPLNILWAIALTRWVLGHVPHATIEGQVLLLLLGWAVVVPLAAYGTAPLLFGLAGAQARDYAGSPSVRFIIVLYGLLTAHTLTQMVSFGLDAWQMLATAGIGLGLAFTLSRFTIRPLSLPTVLLALSRYALEIYVVHLALFIMLLRIQAGRG